jgi:hypothetical protein
VEAYVKFFHATPAEIEIAFPFGVRPPEEKAPRPTEAAMQRADAMLAALPTLSCFSITEQEIDALGDAFGLPRPPRPPNAPTPDQVAEMIGASSSTQPLPESRLIPVWYYPGACGTIYEIPRELAAKLRVERDLDDVGARWNVANLAAGPNLSVIEESSGDAGRIDPRDDVRVWRAIVRDLAEFARMEPCGARKLYVEIQYDC